MKIGKMRRKVTIRTMTRAPDGMGGYTESPVDVPNVWAAVEPLEGREQLEAMQTVGQRPHLITLRYRPGLTGAQAILYDGRTFDIKSVVDPDEKHRELVLMTDEVTA